MSAVVKAAEAENPLNEELLALRAENAALRAEVATLKSLQLSHQNRTVEVKFIITRTDEGSITNATIKCYD
jgi:hypothetical protein